MPRYIAFLRAINVGGHTVKMDHLRRLFESFGLAKVETFIASGNVAFSASSKAPASLEQRISTGLRAALGYEVATFVRTEAELAEIAARIPFPPATVTAAKAMNVAFLASPLVGGEERKVLSLRTEIDDFAIRGREIYWLCRRKQSQSAFSNALLERTLGVRSTLRGFNTVQQLAAKYPGDRS